MSILLLLLPLLPPEQKAVPKGRAWPMSLNSSFSSRCPPTPYLLPARCWLAPGLGCPPHARKLFTKGNNSDKGTKIASNDGKHFVERSVDKRGNRAVKKIAVKDTEGEAGRLWRSREPRSSWDRAQRPRQPHGWFCPNGPSFLLVSGPNPVPCDRASRQ